MVSPRDTTSSPGTSVKSGNGKPRYSIARETAKDLKRILGNDNILREETEEDPKYEYYVSDIPEKFAAIAEDLHIDPKAYISAIRKVPVRPEKSIRAAAELLENVVNRVVLQEYMNATEYKKILVWEEEIEKATSTVAAIKKNTRELEAIASKQTIMALNASIETARVGAAGAGFGIIAKQMGEFSKQSAEIYKQITEDANKISDSIVKMNNA